MLCLSNSRNWLAYKAENVQTCFTELIRRNAKTQLIFMGQLGHCCGKSNGSHQRKLMKKYSHLSFIHMSHLEMVLLLFSAAFINRVKHAINKKNNCCDFSPILQRLYCTILYVLWSTTLAVREILDLYSPAYQQQPDKRSHRYCFALSDPYWATLCVCVCVWWLVCIKKKKNRKEGSKAILTVALEVSNFKYIHSDWINLNSREL